MELLKPTNDYVFKRIFGQKKNSDILKDLLQAILPNWNIKNVEAKTRGSARNRFYNR